MRFKLYEEEWRALGDQLRFYEADGLLEFCPKDGTDPDKEVEVLFDVCDSYGLCALSGPGKVICHIMAPGPAIVAFQYLTNMRGQLRLVFDVATSTPDVSAKDATQVVSLSDPGAELRFGKWEEVGKALRLTLEDTVHWHAGLAAAVTAQILELGLLRDAAKSTHPSLATSPALVDFECPSGTLLYPSETLCRPCASGSVVRYRRRPPVGCLSASKGY